MSKQFLLKTLLFFYLTFSFMGAIHIHNDSEDHLDDCQICIIVKAFSNVDLPKNEIVLNCLLCNYIVEILCSPLIKIINLKGI